MYELRLGVFTDSLAGSGQAGGRAMRLSIRCVLVVVFVLGMRGVGVAQCDAFKRVFVTSTTYDGNLGGLAGADAKCAARAAAAGLSGTYKAWLSDQTTSAASRLTHAAVPYKRTDGVAVANNWTDLTDGDLAVVTSPSPFTVGINHDEFGVALSSGTVGAWTATLPDGSTADPSGVLNCFSWTSNVASASPSGGIGYALDIPVTLPVGNAGSAWTAYAIESCSSLYRLYCLQQ